MFWRREPSSKYQKVKKELEDLKNSHLPSEKGMVKKNSSVLEKLENIARLSDEIQQKRNDFSASLVLGQVGSCFCSSEDTINCSL